MPWWGKSETPKDEQPSSANSSTEVDKLPPREKLPANLQKIVDKANADNSNFFDDVKEGKLVVFTSIIQR